MQKTVLLATTLLLGIAVFLWWSRGQDGDEELARMLADRESKRAVQTDSSDNDAVDFDTLALQGKAQPLPPYLQSSLDPTGFWFVGKSDSRSGVEIPFKPGSVPTKPAGKFAETNGNPGFLGAEACRECHRQRHDDFIHTAHFHTSHPATPEFIAGSFVEGENELLTGDPDVHFQMMQRGEESFQRVSFYDWQFEIPFHIITGSSKMAQTYLYWNHDKLYQMNVSYLTSKDAWINSPGYVDGDAAYARPISTRCMECHTTYIQNGTAQNQFDPESVIYGVSCERCHGPGQDHVAYHQDKPDDRIAKHIATPSKLNRQQQLDICGQCHTSVTPFKSGPFQFRPGDRLEDHYQQADSQSGGSVHTSNQLARLLLSPCFVETEMTCSDCHNPHKKERGQLELFSQRCMKCHEPERCGMHDQLGETLQANCIDCHMPNRESEKLWLNTRDEKLFPALRDHHIRVDQAATQEFLQKE